MFTLSELRVFVSAAQLGSFSQTATELQLSQPAISQTVASMEAKVGAALFERGGWGVRLTERGQLLLPLARQVLQAEGWLERAVKSSGGEVEGRLTLAYSGSRPALAATMLCAGFRERNPAVRFRLIEVEEGRLLELLLAGRWPFGLSMSVAQDQRLTYHTLFEEELVLAVPERHPFAGMDHVPLEELAGQAMVTVEGAIGTAVRSALEARGLTPGQLDTVMEGLPLAAAVAAIGRGAGLAFLPAGVVKSVGASTGLRAVLLESVEIRLPIALVRGSQAPMTHLHAHFWSYALAQGAPAVEEMADS